MQRYMFWLHSISVLAAGALVGWFVQSQKIQTGIDSGWNIRFVFLVLAFGSLAYVLWLLIAGIGSKLLKKDMASFLQADAYSYFALIPLLSYQNYQRFAGLRLIILGVAIGFILLKVILFILAYSGRMPSLLSFSLKGKAVHKALFSFLFALGAHYAHQTSLAAYWTDIQEKQVLLIEGEARSCFLLPAGCSIDYEIEFPEQGSLWLAYAVAETDARELGFGSPKMLDVYIGARDSDMEKWATVALSNKGDWNDVNVGSEKNLPRGAGKIRIAARGGVRIFSWPWADPLSGAVAIAGPKALIDPASAAKPPIIILITVDALRADYIGSMGHDRSITPNLDSLAAEGVAFPRAVSGSTWTIPSNIGMLSSLPVSKTHSSIEAKKLSHYTFIDVLAENHFLTAAVTDGGWISSETAFMNGFYIFRENRCKAGECKAEVNFERASQIIDSWKDYPLFLWIYSNEVHNTTWHPLPAWGECDPDGQQGWIDKYNAKIESFDAALGDFLERLKELGVYDEAIILLTSDHGNAFGELHDDDKYIPCGHGDFPYNEQILIPIIIKPQKEKNLSPGRIVEEYVSNIDIAPTLLELVELPIPEEFEGFSLASVIGGGPVPQNRRIYSDTALSKKPALTFIEGSRKIMYFPRKPEKSRIRVYDLASDPNETVDVVESIADRKALIEDIQKFLQESQAYRATAKQSVEKREFSPELRRQIRDLGYLQ